MRNKQRFESVSNKALAEYEVIEEAKTKDKQPVVKKERRGTVKVDVLLGDQRAAVTRGRTIKRGIPYGESSISSTCNVYLTCNQDIETIKAASQAAIDIVMDILRSQDASDMKDFIDEAMRSSISNRKKV